MKHEVFAAIEAFAGVEGELRRMLPADSSMRQIVEHPLLGGKRARALLLVAAGAGRLSQPTLYRAAATLEMLHAATLVQDDIFDRSRTRRGRPATHCIFGPQLATLASDWMLAEAIRAAYRLSFEFGEALSRCAQALVAGEAREFAPRARGSIAALRAEAVTIAHGKTGELFGLAVCAPSLLAGAAVCAERLHEAGCALGVAFQYLDDTLDLYGEGKAAGKDVGRDLSAQLLTMPVLDALMYLPSSLTDTVQGGGLPLPAHLLRAICAPAVREQLKACAQMQWTQAVRAVSRELPEGAAIQQLLHSLAGQMLTSEETQPSLSAA